jgi:hypothetical protein
LQFACKILKMALRIWLFSLITAVILRDVLAFDVMSSFAEPIPPSQDPFYTAPKDYHLTKPGTILNFRRAPGNLTLVLGNSSAAYNIVYRTTDSHYRPSWAVTTVLVPEKPTRLNGGGGSSYKGNLLLSYQIPYDSPYINSSPSYSMYGGDVYAIPGALSRGWFVNVPDHEGPLGLFAAGVHSGHATLDSIRAVLQASQILGLSPQPRTALWGYSGGGLVSEWAGELQAHYAPELEIAGAAMGGILSNGTNALPTVSGGLFAGLVPSALVGLSHHYPELEQHLIERLKPSGPFNRTGFFAVEHMAAAQWIAAFQFQNIFDYFINGEADVRAPIVRKIINSDVIAGYHGVPRFPLFFYHAIGDPTCPIIDVDRLVERYCVVEANILFHRNTVGDHLAEAQAGNNRAFSWLASVLDGSYRSDGCTITEVTEH